MSRYAVIAIALMLGAMASIYVAFWQKKQAGTQVETPIVVIVDHDIVAGRAIAETHVKAIHWPASVVPHDSFTQTSAVVGRIARVAMVPGEPVLGAKLAPEHATGGLSSIIPEGKRAITVLVNEVVAVAGFALPGSYVDVLVSGKDSEQQVFSRTVLSRIKVLAVAQDTSADPDKPKVVNAVTLELTPHESEKLDLARNIGKLSLVLRNEFDTREINSAGVRMPDILYPQPMEATSSEQIVALDGGLDIEEIRGIKQTQ